MVMPAAMGMVATHDFRTVQIILRFKAEIPRASPTPITEPTRVWVVEIGMPILEKSRTVVAAPNVAENPLEGVMSAIFLPMVSITRFP